jgi:hypothetical protein
VVTTRIGGIDQPAGATFLGFSLGSWSASGSVAYTLCGWVTSGSLVPGGGRGAGYHMVPIVRRLEGDVGK